MICAKAQVKWHNPVILSYTDRKGLGENEWISPIFWFGAVKG